MAGIASQAQAQQLVSHRSDSGVNNWWDGANPWYYHTWNNNQNRPDNNSGTANDVQIGHNNNTAMLVNGNTWYNIRTLNLQSGATTQRTFRNPSGETAGLSMRGSGTVKIENNSSAWHTFGVQVGLDASVVEFNPLSGGLTFTNAIFLNANQLQVFGANGHTVQLDGSVSGTGGLWLRDNSTLHLTTSNSFTGTATVSAGTLRASVSQHALGASTNVTLAGGTLALAGSSGLSFGRNTFVTGNATIRSDRTVANNAGVTHTLGTLSIGAQTLTVNAGGNVSSGTAGITFGNTTFSATGPVFNVDTGALLTLGALQSAGNFTKQGAGQLNIGSAANAARTSGTVTLTAGTLRLDNVADALGTTGVSISQSGGNLQLGRTGTINAYATTISGNSTITPDRAASGGAQTLTLGTLSIGANTLTIAKGSNYTAGAVAGLTFGSTTFSASGAVFDVASEVELTLGALQSTGNFTKQGAGQLSLSTAANAARNSGTVTLAAGKTRTGAAAVTSQFGTAAVSLNLTGGELEIASTSSINAHPTTVGGNFTITSSRAGSGGSNTHTLGTLSIGASTLTVNKGANFTAGGIAGLAFGATTLTGAATFDVGTEAALTFNSTVNNGGFLMTVQGAGNTTASGIISGSGGLTKAGAGNLALTAANTHSGNTTVNAGTLVLSGGGSMANTPQIILGTGAGLNVSAPTTALSLAAGQSLRATATGGNATATVTVASSKNLTLSAGGLVFTARGSGATAPLTVAGTGGALALNSAPVTVTTTTALTAGTYTLIAKSGSAAVTGTPGALTVNGSGLGAGQSAVLSVTNGELVMVVGAVPAAPTITSITPGNGQLSVAFTAGSDGGSAITDYKWSLDGTTYTLRAGTASPIVITGLTNGQSYTVRIRAVNAIGDGAVATGSPAIPVTTPAAPTISSISAGDRQLSVNFTAGTTGGSAITTYKYSTDGGSSFRTRSAGTTGTPLVITTLSSDGVTQLSNGASYNVRILAVNAVGDGAATATTAATPVASSTAPAAPTLGTITPGNGTLSVAFTPGSDGGAAITNYEFRTSTNGGGAWTAWTTRSPVATTSPLVISSLVNGTEYTVQIRAVNSVGSGTASNSGTGTPRTTPGAPTLGAITPGNGQLSVAFTAPTDTGGSAITGYEWSLDGTSYTLRAGTANPIVITGLDNGTAYTVRIRAVNAAGSGTAVTAGAAATPSTTPGTPTITGITPGNAQLTVAFTAPSTGGSAITDYEYSTDGGTSFKSAATTSSPFTITTVSASSAALENGTPYNVQIRARNANGVGTATSSSASTPRTTPGTPTSVTVTPGNAQLSVAFTAPASDGGSAITDYEYSTDGGTSFKSSGATSSPIAITTVSASSASLANGTSYNVQLRAVNAAGPGTATASVSGTPRTTPSVTTGAASSVAAYSATLGGNITVTGGENPTTRGVEHSTSNNFTTGTGTRTSSSGSFSTGAFSNSPTGLASGSTYYYRAFASNSAGIIYGVQSNFTTLTVPGGRNPDSSNPTNSFLGDTVTLSLNAWKQFNGTNRSFGTVFGRFGNADLTTGTSQSSTNGVSPSLDQFSVNTSRLTNTGTFYWAIRVSWGSGNDYWFDGPRTGWSDLGLTAPTNSPLSIEVSALNNPTSVTATNTSTSQINLTWTKGISGGEKNTMIVRRTDTNFTAPTQGTAYTNGSTALSGGTVVYNDAGTSFFDTNLTPGTTYYYRLYAENWSYYSSGADASAATPGTPAITVSGLTNNVTTAAFTTTYGTPSAAQNFTIGGANLSTNITATAPTGFQVSTNDATYTNAVTFTQSGGTAGGTLYMRLSASANAGNYNSVSVTLSSTGATNRTITTPATGNSVAQATPNISALPSVGSSLIKGDTLFNGLLSGGSASVGGTFGFGDLTNRQTTTGSKTITFTPSDSTNFTSVSTNVSVTVDAVPDPTSVSATSGGTNSISLTHTRASGRNVMIVRRADSAVSFTPTDGTNYSNGQNLGGGQTVVHGSLAADTTTDSGLVAGTTYYYKIFSENWGYYSAGATASAATANLPPAISVSTNSLASLSATYGAASSPASFTASGSNLTNNLSVSAPTHFEVSTSSASGYASSITLTPSGGTVNSTTLYVRLKNNAAPGALSGNVTLSSGGATSQTVAVSGTVTVPSMSMTIASSNGSLNADYTTTKLYADEVAGATNNITVTFNTGNSNAAEVEVWSNMNNRERADNDANNDGIHDGIVPPAPPTEKPEGYVSGAYPTNGYFQAIPMSGSGGTYTVTLNANKTGAYRLTARYRANGGEWIWYNRGGKRDHAITVAPVLARNMNVYEINVLNVNATGSTFATRSTFEDLTNYSNGKVNLDYLRSLGVNTLWFQPIHPNGIESREAPGGTPYDPGSPYAVKNFFEVMEIMTVNYNGGSSASANRTSSMAAFTNFVAAADAKGVHVMLDAPFNHTAHDVELAQKGLDLLAAAGLTTTGWAATDKIKDREVRFFSSNTGGSQYAGPASSAANIAVAPDRNDFGKWNDVIDVFFGRYATLVTGNPSAEATLVTVRNEEDWINMDDLQGTGGVNATTAAVTRAVWQYFAAYVPYWLEKTGLPENSSTANQATKGIDGLRADFGQGMPPQFWEYAINVARERKWSFVFMTESLDGFEVTYRSNRHFDILNENIVFPWQAANNTTQHREIFESRRTAYGEGLVLLNNTSHDEAGYADPWQAFIRYAVGSTIDGAPMIMYGQEIGTAASLSFDHYEVNFGKSIPHFKRYNSMQPQWTAWGSNSLGVQNLIPAYSGVGLAREFSPALRSSNRWFLNPVNTVSADEQIFAVAKYETANASPATSDVVLAFVNGSRSNNVSNTFGIPSGLATLMGLESGKLYNVKNIAAYLGPNNEYPNRRNQFLWETPRTGGDILQNGVYVALNGVPTTDAGWATNPHEAQYLKVYAAPVITTGEAPGALSSTYGSPSTNGTMTFAASDVHDGLTISAPAGFQISTNSSSGFTQTLAVANTGAIGNTTLYIRLAGSNALGSYSGNLTFASAGGNSATVALASSAVGKATPTITTNPVAAAITYGQALSAATLTGGASSVPGGFAFTAAGTTPNATVATNFSVTFTPTDTANYNAVSLDVSVTVNPKALTGSFTASNKVYDGTTAATVATRAVDGKVGSDDVNHTGGTATFGDANAGNGKTVTLASAGLTGAAAGNYTLSSVSTTTANITPATPTITAAPTASAISEGQALSSSTLSGGTATGVGGGALGGQFAFTSPGTTPAVGTANQGVTFTPTDTTNYNNATTSVSVTVNAASEPLPPESYLAYNQDGTFTLKIGEQAVTNVSYLYTGRTNGVGTLNTTYAFMTYSNSQAPTTPGFYTVTATASGGYSGTRTTDFGKPGLLMRTLEMGRTANTRTNNLTRTALFSGLQCITTNLTLTNGSTNATFLTFTNGLSTMTNGDTFPNTITLFTATTLRLFPAYSNSIFDTFTLTVAPAAHAGNTNPMVFPVLVTATNSASSGQALLDLVKLDPIEGDTNYVRATFMSRPNRAIQIEFRQTLNEPWRPLQDPSLPVTRDHQNLTRTNANNQVEALPMATITPASGVSRFTVPASGMFFRGWTVK